jgi:DNA-directed RNA polymerase specialized sigma24 family protein
MNSPAFEEVFPTVRDLARKKAHSVVGQCGLTPDDREDVAGQLVATFYVQFEKFDGGRASLRTFASRVMDAELASILRYRTASRRRDPGNQSLDAGTEELADHGADFERLHFWIDVDRALATFPHVLLDTARALCWHTPSELSRAPGQSRTAVYRRMRRLREALLAAGIGPNYFAAAGDAR